MGFRFIKSINLGGRFKINFNKHGIGYSWLQKNFVIHAKTQADLEQQHQFM